MSVRIGQGLAKNKERFLGSNVEDFVFESQVRSKGCQNRFLGLGITLCKPLPHRTGELEGLLRKLQPLIDSLSGITQQLLQAGLFPKQFSALLAVLFVREQAAICIAGGRLQAHQSVNALQTVPIAFLLSLKDIITGSAFLGMQLMQELKGPLLELRGNLDTYQKGINLPLKLTAVDGLL